ncbi:MAG: hypothetical protein AAGA48_26575 [Myxococcota bacterium]
MITVWLGMAVAQSADCELHVPAVEVVALAEAVQRLLVDDNGAVYRARATETQLVEELGCVAEPLSPQGAASVLQIRGFTAFFAGETVDAQAYLASARHAVPDLSLSPQLAPHPAHPLARVWAEAQWDGRTVALPPAPGGVWLVNGRATNAMPQGLPVVLQLVRPDGTVAESSITDRPPVIEPPPSPDVPAKLPTATPGFPKKFVTGLGVALVGGVAMAVPVVQSSQRCTLPDSDDDGLGECPTGLLATYWTGVGLVSAGGVLALWGAATEFRKPPLQVSVHAHRGVHAQVAWTFTPRR